jgi:hypothetical protein
MALISATENIEEGLISESFMRQSCGTELAQAFQTGESVENLD